jgi:two-component system response regulator AtoC
MKRILIVDDEVNMAAALEMLFQAEGYETRAAGDVKTALELARRGERFDVVLSDLKLPDASGIEFLKSLHDEGIDTPFILITAYGTVEKAVEAMKLGAVDVITKPFNKEMILPLVSRVCSMQSLKEENQLLRQAIGNDTIICASQAMQRIVSVMGKVGPVSTPVLISGESGTGKEIVARMLHAHYAGEFDAKPFVSVNCPAVPENLLESELFGYRKGAFTGANKDFKGRVAIADGGTLFFDEIGDLPLNIQPKLLRLLENKTYEPLGATASGKVDIRVLCATNKELKRLVSEGKFRGDLFYRINAITIDIPPLRERPADVPVLADAFLRRFSRELGKCISGFEERALEKLSRYRWPGNVRELKNVIERAVVLCVNEKIGLEDLPVELRNGQTREDEDKGENKLESAERRLLVEALDASDGNVSEAARKLGISRNTIRYRIQKFGLNNGRYSP